MQEQQQLYFTEYSHVSTFYYIDTSVLLENIPLVKFIKLHPGPEWFIFHNLTREFIDDVISVISLRNFITYHFLEFYVHIFQSFAYILSL